jgi:hypothetical protein
MRAPSGVLKHARNCTSGQLRKTMTFWQSGHFDTSGIEASANALN